MLYLLERVFLRACLFACVGFSGIAAGQVRIGEPSPDLGLEELLFAPEGVEGTLESLRGKTIVMEFWATWCMPCIAAIPHLNELRGEFIDEDVVFISVTDEPAELVNKFQQRIEPIDGWIGLDHDRSLFDGYQIEAIPATIIIDGRGRFVGRTTPRQLTAEKLRAYMDGAIDDPQRGGSDPQEQVPAMAATQQLASRPTSYTMAPGIDPYSAVQTPADSIFIFRRSIHIRDHMNSMRSPKALTALGATAGQVLDLLYHSSPGMVDRSQLDLDDAQRYDLVVGGSFPMDTARDAVLAVLGIEEHAEQRELELYRLEAAAGGPRGLADMDEPVGMFTGPFIQSGRITWESNRIEPTRLAQVLGDRLGMAVELGIDPSLRFDAELTIELPNTDEEISRHLTDRLGLRLVKDRATRAVTVLVARESGA